MATWGYDIFDNDVATDVRGVFEDELQLRASVPHATAVVLREWKDAMDDPDDGPIVWLALAALQVERDALQTSVRDHALAVIDDGAGMRGWEESASTDDHAGRMRVLADLRGRLASAKASS